MGVVKRPATRPRGFRHAKPGLGGAPEPVSRGIDPADHIEWAKMLGRLVAKRCGLLAHADELEGEALLVLCERAAAFVGRPLRAGSTEAEAFRGYAQLRITMRCVQHAERVVNGGTYHTRKHVMGGGRKPLHAKTMSALAPNEGDALDFTHDDEHGDVPAVLKRRAVVRAA